MVKFRSFFVCTWFLFLLYFLLLPRSFSQFLCPPHPQFFLFVFFLSSSFSSFSLQCLAFLNSLSKFLHLSVHMVGDRSNPFSLISDEICSHKCLFDFGLDPRLSSLVLDPCLGSLLGSLDFDFNFLVLVTAIAIAENHLLVLVVRVGVSMRVRLRSVVGGRTLPLAPSRGFPS